MKPLWPTAMQPEEHAKAASDDSVMWARKHLRGDRWPTGHDGQ